MCFDPHEIETVKQKNSSKCSYLICCRGQVQRPFPSDSLAVRRIFVLLMTSNEHRQLGQCIVNGRTAQLTSRFVRHPVLHHFSFGNTTIELSDKVRDLGVILDKEL